MLSAIALFATTHVQFPRLRAQRSLFSLWSGAIDPGYKVYERRLFRELFQSGRLQTLGNARIPASV